MLLPAETDCGYTVRCCASDNRLFELKSAYQQMIKFELCGKWCRSG